MYAVLLIDAEIALSSINRNVIMLHDLKFIWSIINATYIIICYTTQSDLFTSGGEKTFSSECAIQGDPTSMGTYELGILSLIKFLLESIHLNEMNANEVVLQNTVTSLNLRNLKKTNGIKSQFKEKHTKVELS